MAPTISELWYAVYADGGWSRPTRLHEGGRLRWSRGDGGMAFDPADSVLNIVFDTRPAGEGGPGSSATLLLRVRDGAPIEVDTILRLGNPTRLATAAHGGSSHVAYVHWDTVDEATRVHVASFRAADRRWEAPVVLNRGTRRRTGDVWIFTSPNGALDVLWTERAGDLLFGPTFLHHAWKASASGEWTRDEPFALPGGGGHGWSAVMDRCGGLHFVRAVADERGFPRLEYAENASGGGWRSVEVPTSGVASLEPVLAAGADGVYLAWSEVGDGSDGGPPGARLMVSRRPIR